MKRESRCNGILSLFEQSFEYAAGRRGSLKTATGFLGHLDLGLGHLDRRSIEGLIEGRGVLGSPLPPNRPPPPIVATI